MEGTLYSLYDKYDLLQRNDSLGSPRSLSRTVTPIFFLPAFRVNLGGVIAVLLHDNLSGTIP